jgi:hypothetical protein
MPDIIRTLTNSAARWKPFPWSRYSRDEFPRENPLPRCPSAKCRRAKSCVAAHKDLYCQRTHFSTKEGKARVAKSTMEKEIEKLTQPPPHAALQFHMDYMKEVSDLQKMEERERMKLWRAGALPSSFGRYRTTGVMKLPPPKEYVE